MPTYKIIVAYDGGGFVGWQRQAEGVSIQGLLEDAARELDERDVTVFGAGRTDAGVHALGQVASFTLARAVSPDVVVRAMNARLPPAVRVLSAEEAAPGFHARFDAKAKRYRYRIANGDVLSPFDRRYAWHVPGALDVEAMARAALMLEGRHDFAAFQAGGSDVATTTRTIVASRLDQESARATSHSKVLCYDVSGDGFLRHMVRAIAGTLVEIGRGRRPAEWMRDVVASRDRSLAGRTAPSEGLFLVGVDYA